MKTCRIAICTFATCLIALMGGISSGAEPTGKSLPNIIFILADDLGYMDLGCHGSTYYETPNIDRFSKTAMEFSSFYSSPTCAPTRAALLTGKSPARVGVTCVGRLPGPPLAKTLPQSDYSLPGILDAAGYQTAIFGKWGVPGPVDSGFGIAKTGGGIVQSHFPPWYKNGRKSTLPVAREGEYLADVLTSEACDFMASGSDKPFFIYLPYYAVHAPFQAPKALIDKYEAIPAGEGPSNPIYAAMVENFDTNVGKLLAKIDHLGLADDTIVIFTSDNGGLVHFFGLEVTSNAPLRGEKGMLYEGGIRVPFFIRWPGTTKPSSRCKTPIAMEDMLPTLADIADFKIPSSVSKELDGISIVPLLNGESVERENLYWHYPHYHDRFEARPVSAIRSGDWKLLDFMTEEKLELYNLVDDLGENNNLAEAHPEQVKDLHKKLQDWRERVGAKMPPSPGEVQRMWEKNKRGIYRRKKS